MFQNFALKAMAAASPVRIKGVALASVSAIAFFEPKAPTNSFIYDSIGLTPANMIKMLAIISENITAPIGAKKTSQGETCSRCSNLKSIIETFPSHHKTDPSTV